MVQSSPVRTLLLLLLPILALFLTATPGRAFPVSIEDGNVFTEESLVERDWPHPLSQRDAHTIHSDPNGDTVHVTSLKAPTAATLTSYRVGGGDIPTFRGLTPTRPRLARRAYIIVHGVKRDGSVYWTRKAGIADDANSIRIAPEFLSTRMDPKVRTGTRLGWADQDGWSGGDAATAPVNATANLAAILDYYLDSFSNKATYPLLDTVVFVGHGAGAQAVQRYAVLGKDPSRASLKVRYVVANPSTNLYFTIDRPQPVNPAACPYFNDFRYGLESYDSPYPKTLSDVNLFKRYLSRDVRYLVGDADTKDDEGDQNCAALAAGGVHRRDRNLDYWAYLHLLSGTGSVPNTSTGTSLYPVSSSEIQATFRTTTFNHQLTVVPRVGHSASKMLGSVQALRAIFGK
ncbi:hypothetical protein BCV69DRAFT_287886 [Microstroma glucosiphilum]|uniref:AB hydrolase-1 domain-containing protein n=1 Tax=Pseudomicrostroma glucosiphilum TaxID=1684307 RepID=A0A316U388_9BASI|nr:hypothetical protein BCV69DRAFT_287886 [Pseudomicrostroma glucosiphilum]PWN19772.1 hypothetical protein BCV69DRAFT_287886 [Pseudomicrostroma glucosiphilum]